MNLREAVLTATLKTGRLDTDRFGTIHFRELNLDERMRLHAGLPADYQEANRIYTGRLIRFGVIESPDKPVPVFTEADELVLATRFGAEGESLVEGITRLSGMGAVSREKKENSGETIPDGSSSGSASPSDGPSAS